MDVIAAYRDVGTYRGAAAICGTTHKTVKRIIEAHELPAGCGPARRGAAGPELRRGRRPGRGEGRQGRGPDQREAVAAGRAGRGLRGVGPQLPAAGRRREAGVAGRRQRRGRRPAVWTPGRDAGHRLGRVQGGGCTCSARCWPGRGSGSSGSPPTRRQPTTLAMLAECFEVLGGVPKVVLADRMGCLKGGVVANVVVPAPDYVRFASHYRFRPDFCHAADPESKGIVENLVGYAKDDLMVPLELETTRAAGRCRGANARRAGVVREVNASDAFGDLRGPGSGWPPRASCSGSCRRCGWSRCRSRPPARSTSSPASGSARRATRSRTG